MFNIMPSSHCKKDLKLKKDLIFSCLAFWISVISHFLTLRMYINIFISEHQNNVFLLTKTLNKNIQKVGFAQKETAEYRKWAQSLLFVDLCESQLCVDLYEEILFSFLSLDLLLLLGCANKTPWYTTELISRETTKELSPPSPERNKKNFFYVKVGPNWSFISIKWKELTFIIS